MKKNLAKKVTLSILAGAVLMSSSVVWAMSNTGSGSDPDYWEDRSHLGYVRLPANTEGDVFLVIEDYGCLDFGKAFFGTVSFDKHTTAANGIVTINDSIGDEYTFTNGIYGGAALIDDEDEDEPGSDANNNKVFITTSKATIMSNVYGGYSDDGNAEGNSVTITGGTFSDPEITGGYAKDGNAEGNSVTITDGTFSDCEIVGGASFGGDATGNSVTITGGTFSDYEMTGGYADDGNATG
ncbi:MAG: hypothetical protein IJN33_01910, partial [Phascolarctobacterium sp.]|nr:hypothetical protein [Phascolarctobacterium sp.]